MENLNLNYKIESLPNEYVDFSTLSFVNKETKEPLNLEDSLYLQHYLKLSLPTTDGNHFLKFASLIINEDEKKTRKKKVNFNLFKNEVIYEKTGPNLRDLINQKKREGADGFKKI